MAKTIHIPTVTQQFAEYGLEPINEELTARGFDETSDATVGAMLLASGCRSLDEYAGCVVNLTRGQVSGEALTNAMKRAFPNHNIGERHGPHYLSHARNGGLNLNTFECRYSPAKETRKAKKGIALDVASMTDKQRAELAKVLKNSNPELAKAVLEWKPETK